MVVWKLIHMSFEHYDLLLDILNDRQDLRSWVSVIRLEDFSASTRLRSSLTFCVMHVWIKIVWTLVEVIKEREALSESVIGSFRKQLVEPEKMFEPVSQRSQFQILMRHVFFTILFLQLLRLLNIICSDLFLFKTFNPLLQICDIWISEKSNGRWQW